MPIPKLLDGHSLGFGWDTVDFLPVAAVFWI